MTLMKSKRPRVDHCSLTVAPSCSISLLTSRMRDGLFLTVWTPSGVRVVSMMYVGMGWESARVGVRPTPDADAASGLRSEEQRDELRQAALPPVGVARRRRVVGEAAVHERQLRRMSGRRELDRHERLEGVRDAALPAPGELQAPGRVVLVERADHREA